MKRLLLLLMLFSTPVLAEEPIEMICQKGDVSLTINLATNKVQFGGWQPLDIYFKNDKYIIWIGHYLSKDGEHNDFLVLFSLDRKSGKLQFMSTYVDSDKVGSRSVKQCFRSF